MQASPPAGTVHYTEPGARHTTWSNLIGQRDRIFAIIVIILIPYNSLGL